MTSTQKTLLCHYRYDPLDRLINHTRADTPSQQRFYCKSRLATEIQGTMQHSILQHGDLLLAQQQRLGDEVNATLLATDLQRSVLHTLEKNHQRQAIAYSPYGHRHAENGLTSLLGFNGEQPDPVTLHYLLGNGYRAFNPVLMRFNSPDNLSPFGKGGMNSYVYCLGNPTNRNDPSGHFSILTWARAALTRTVKGFEYRNASIKTGVNISDALRARDKIKELNRETAAMKKDIFDTAYNNRHDPKYNVLSSRELQRRNDDDAFIETYRFSDPELYAETTASETNKRATEFTEALEYMKANNVTSIKAFNEQQVLIPLRHTQKIYNILGNQQKALFIRAKDLNIEILQLTNRYFKTSNGGPL
jgi:RHS repeat-associated protein